MKREETFDFHIKTAWHSIARMYNAEAGKYGFSIAIGYILLNIDDEGTPATKIAPLLGLEARSITRTLKNMENEKLIYKVQDTKDRRVFHIFLTEKGKEKRKVASKTVKGFNQALHEKVNKEDFTTFLKVMKKIQQTIEEDF